jgi:Domain of Unknown Function (DUF1080)
MKPVCYAAGVLLPLMLALTGAGDTKEAAGFVPMFNGKDLAGWVNVNCAPGTFFVQDDMIITTGKPTGYLRTAKQYENFIADFEWLHVNKTEVGNSGFFVWADPLPGVGTPYTRGIEVQVLVNLEKEGFYTSQGDLFSIHGATCKPDRPHPQGWMRCLPSEKRCKGGGEWNHYKVIGKDGTLKLHVNGKEVSGLSECKPRKGYLALESEGAECHFRNLKIKELPSSNPKPEEIADVAEDFKNLFTGLDLAGWKGAEEVKKHWEPKDWVLHFDGKLEAKGAELPTEKEFGDCELIADFQFLKNKEAKCGFGLREGEKGNVQFVIGPDGMFSFRAAEREDGTRKGQGGKGEFGFLKPAGQWNRLRAVLKGKSVKVTINGKPVVEETLASAPLKGTFALEPEGEMNFGNLFVRELK